MKQIQNVVLMVLTLGAVNAKAQFQLSPGPVETVVAGDTSQQIAYFNLNVTSPCFLALVDQISSGNRYDSGQGPGIAATAAYDPGATYDASCSPLSLSTDPAKPTSVAVGHYWLAVAWTLDSNVGTGTYDDSSANSGIVFGELETPQLAAQVSGPRPAGFRPTLSGYATDIVNVVPEPAQGIASVALLGCAGLVFMVHRFLGKRAQNIRTK